MLSLANIHLQFGMSFLKGLELSEGTLTPAFDKDTFSYTAAVGNEVEGVQVKAFFADGITAMLGEEALESGVYSEEIPLQVGENEIIVTLRMTPGFYRADIEDNGGGVSEENLEKLFRPNFTTKTRGSGLGLAICKNIVTQSHGDIYYTPSKELGGADFTVILPMYTEVSEDYT